MERSPDDDLLSIGRFARETGLSPKALRLYAELGLLVPAHTDRFTGYRYYRREQMRAATLIRLMRRMEMPLRDIRQALAVAPTEAEQLITRHERAFAERLEQVRSIGRYLVDTIRQEENTMTLPVEERSLARQQVVSITAHTLVKELDNHIRRELERLKQFVAEQGGRISGPGLGIYHGPINHEDDGPIEVCLPAEGAFRAAGDVIVRELPGGRAAVVIARDEYAIFPKIIEAYDAGYDWVVGNGHQPVESPREIWVGSIESGPVEIVWRFE